MSKEIIPPEPIKWQGKKAEDADKAEAILWWSSMLMTGLVCLIVGYLVCYFTAPRWLNPKCGKDYQIIIKK